MYNYETALINAKTVLINDDIVVPPTYEGDTGFSMPDQIVSFCISQYGLLNDNVQVLDPMCGLGTIPRVINNQGGECIGIELDIKRFNAASSVSNGNHIQHGDFLKIELPENSFQCIFTSLPFDWFKQDNNPVNPNYANKITQLLTDDGFVLLDSVPLIQRAGTSWPVALRQCHYLESNGFSLVEMIKFKNTTPTQEISESVIMKFLPNKINKFTLGN